MTSSSVLEHWLHSEAARGLVDLFLPRHCALCGALGAWLCADCLAEIGELGVPHTERASSLPGLAMLAAVAPHIGPAKQVVHQLKYGGMRVLAEPMAALMADVHAELLTSADVLVPVPLHVRRIRRRGYNQAVLLAQELAGRCDCTLRLDVLERTRDTRSQVGLSRAERLANVAGAFGARDHVQGRVLLIDDVCTTGATLSACAAALRQTGAERVSALVFARAINGAGEAV